MMMGETKPFGVALGLLGNLMIGIAMYKLLVAVGCTANLDTLGECTDDIGAAVPFLPIGIVISTVAVFAGGGAVSFLGTFLAVGAGALAASFNANDDFIPQFGKLFGGIFVAVPLFLIALWLFSSQMGRGRMAKAQNLVATGARGVGTIVNVTDTGMTINDNPRVQVTMRIEPEDGSPAFDAQKTATVSRVAIPRAGDRFPVWYDRSDPTRWAYGTDMDPSQTSPEIQALFARAAASAATAAPAPATPSVDSTADQLSKLNDLRMKGVLSDAEFEAAKARLLNA